MAKDNFNIIYERNYQRSFMFAKSYVHDDMIAEDIVSDSLVKYWRLISTQKGEATEALLLSILRNKALDYLRHKAVHDAAIENLEEIKKRELSIRISTLEACDPEEIFREEIRTILQRTLQSLPEQTRRIFEMSRFENKTVKEIAIETNLTVKGVEYHITNTLKLLRINLKVFFHRSGKWYRDETEYQHRVGMYMGAGVQISGRVVRIISSFRGQEERNIPILVRFLGEALTCHLLDVRLRTFRGLDLFQRMDVYAFYNRQCYTSIFILIAVRIRP